MHTYRGTHTLKMFFKATPRQDMWLGQEDEQELSAHSVSLFLYLNLIVGFIEFGRVLFCLNVS